MWIVDALKREGLVGQIVESANSGSPLPSETTTHRGEILIVMTNLGDAPIDLKAGEKIAQMVPVPVLTGAVEQVESLEDSARAEKGFGSSGR